MMKPKARVTQKNIAPILIIVSRGAGAHKEKHFYEGSEVKFNRRGTVFGNHFLGYVNTPCSHNAFGFFLSEVGENEPQQPLTKGNFVVRSNGCRERNKERSVFSDAQIGLTVHYRFVNGAMLAEREIRSDLCVYFELIGLAVHYKFIPQGNPSPHVGWNERSLGENVT